ncbi:MAG: rhodanese-like domain-containing protein, partial [Phycisphaerae bacterium]|nr:rhodanese-like domain-containing protein [Phycisphaerae bacterium]NIX29969.1 rhodanese-like domain-containing protein [Phycisphaerae bacterium]
MKRICLFTVLFVFAGATVWGAGYNYIEAEDLLQRLQKNEELVLLDIQVEEEYQKHHIEGAVATYAYPVN